MLSRKEKRVRFLEQPISWINGGHFKPEKNARLYLKAVGRHYGIREVPIRSLKKGQDCPPDTYKKIHRLVEQFFARSLQQGHTEFLDRGWV